MTMKMAKLLATSMLFSGGLGFGNIYNKKPDKPASYYKRNSGGSKAWTRRIKQLDKMPEQEKARQGI